MNVTATSTFLGANIYAQHPVVHFTVESMAQHLSAQVKQGVVANIDERLPGLLERARACGAVGTPGQPGELAIEHLFEHVCVELQNLAGAQVCCVRATGAADAASRLGNREAVVAYEEEDVCLAAAACASDLFASVPAAILPSTWTAPANGNAPAFDWPTRLEAFMAFAVQRMLPVQDRALVRAAQARDIPATRLAGRFLVLGQGRHQQRLSATHTTQTNVVSNHLAANKDYARRVLHDLGLPVPAYHRVYRRRDAVAAAKAIGYDVVVKPNNGSMGHGVSVGMTNRREVRDAYLRAREYGRSVLVEEFIEGADYRMLVINGKLCAASKRVPGHVVGDGQHTIEELVAELNRDPRRGSGPTFAWTRIQLDDQADRLIAKLGYTRSSVPATGEAVYLRRNANTSDGGTAVDVTDEVHPDNRYIAERAAMAIGLDIAGVDLITRDISVSIREQGGTICEINSRPGLRKHMWPAEGKPRDVMSPIVDMLFPPERHGRIPVVVIIGAGDTGGASEALAHILTRNGKHVGLASRRGVCSGGVASADIPPTHAATRRVLLDPQADVAILEVTADDILRHGLGCDAVDVAVIVNAGANDADAEKGAAEMGGAQGGRLAPAMLDAIRVVVRTTRGAVLLSESDTRAGIKSGFDDKKWVHVISRQQPPWRDEAEYDHAQRAMCERNCISIYGQAGLEARIAVGGSTAMLEQSALFGGLAAYSLGGEPADISAGLASFSATRS